MFAEVMSNPEICIEVINRIIPDRKVVEIRYTNRDNEISQYIHSEDVIVPQIPARGIRIDVRFEDSESWYAIEMQVLNEKNIPKRSRYIHSAMDVDHLKRGRDVKELKTGYGIFICCFDFFGKHRSRYFFESYDVENDLSLGDERYTIILNTADSEDAVSDELKALLQYINSGVVNENDDFIESLDKRVESIANSEAGEKIMTLQDMLDSAKEQGENRGRRNTVFELYAEGLLDLETAAEKLQLADDEFASEYDEFKTSDEK